MNSIKNVIVVSGVAAALTLASLGAAKASKTMKPLQGISFHVGTKHAVGYFLTYNGSCKLVLTRADDENFAPTRFEAAIEDGQSTRYQLAEGKSLEFGCQAGGQHISVNSLETTAGN
jgi:hypothetical protein